MGDYPKIPYPIIIDGSVYFVHEQKKNRFFVTHQIPHSRVSRVVETGIFVFSRDEFWRVDGGSDINERLWDKIFQAIESKSNVLIKPGREPF
jgi:hypothetical protein